MSISSISLRRKKHKKKQELKIIQEKSIYVGQQNNFLFLDNDNDDCKPKK